MYAQDNYSLIARGLPLSGVLREDTSNVKLGTSCPSTPDHTSLASEVLLR